MVKYKLKTFANVWIKYLSKTLIAKFVWQNQRNKKWQPKETQIICTLVYACIIWEQMVKNS